MSIKSLKTPLRYPGGKSKAIKTLSQWYPKIISEYREPFIGGGSIAIDVTKSNPDIPVWINDLYVPLYNFWVQLRDRGEELSERVREEKQNTLDEGDKELDLDNIFYEMIVLAFPTKRQHKLNSVNDDECNKEMVNLINKYSIKENKNIDPRWEALKKLK